MIIFIVIRIFISYLQNTPDCSHIVSIFIEYVIQINNIFVRYFYLSILFQIFLFIDSVKNICQRPLRVIYLITPKYFYSSHPHSNIFIPLFLLKIFGFLSFDKTIFYSSPMIKKTFQIFLRFLNSKQNESNIPAAKYPKVTINNATVFVPYLLPRPSATKRMRYWNVDIEK